MRCVSEVHLRRVGGLSRIGMFWPSLAWKPRLWLGLWGLWLSKSLGRAKATVRGLAWPGPASGRGFFKAIDQGLAVAQASGKKTEHN